MIRNYAAFSLSVAMTLALEACSSGSSSPPAEQTTQEVDPVRTTESGLMIEDVAMGTGAEAVAGNAVTVDYTGTLADGTKFDSSLDRNKPFRFVLGASKVIKGWDEGVVGMREGGERKLTIPPELGYGKAGSGNLIPPDATLFFDIQLLTVK